MPLFTVVVSNGGGAGGGGSDSTITPANDSVSLTEDNTATGNIFTNDSTTEGTLEVIQFTVEGDSAIYRPSDTAISITSRGSFTLESTGAYSFTPSANYSGAVPRIKVLITNGTQVRVSFINITVNSANDAPVSNDDARITLVNTPIAFNVLSNDQDPDGDSLSVSHVNTTAVSSGSVITIGSGTAEYRGAGDFIIRPSTGFTGSLSFSYTGSDGTLSDGARVTVLVGAANNPMFSAASPLAGTLGQAAYNFGLTAMGRIGSSWSNGTNVSSPPYSANQGLFDLANREPWLYDRASTIYTLYLRTQDPTILTYALTLADLYMSGTQVTNNSLGTFNIVGGDNGANPTDIKYLYPAIGVWYEKETGSSVHRNRCIALYNQALLSFSKTYSATSAALWTERNTAFAIMACVSAYWLYRNAGNRTAAATALQDAWDYVTMLETMSASSGAPLHGHNQHEGSAITTLITSPWMYAFLAEALIQLYRTDPNVRILNLLSNYGVFLLANAFYVTNENDVPEIQGLRLPAYLVANTGTPTTFREGELLDMEHAFDVAGLIRKIIWARTELGLSTVAYEELLAELDTVSAAVFTYWTRNTEGYPRYRVNPPRKYGWWFRNTYSDTSLFYTGRVPSAPLLATTASISGSTQAGSTLTLTAPTWDCFPSASNTYQWYSNSTIILNATGSTFVTSDTGSHYVVISGSNSAGTAATTTNTITVIAAGAPEITVNPSNASTEVGQTVQFTATCTATPEATYQWQVSTDGGSTWGNVSGGTGGSGTGNTTTYTTAALISGDNGNRYRCVFTNAAGSTNTTAGILSLVVDQGAARFTSNDTGAQMTFDIGTVGHSDVTYQLLMYIESRTSNALFAGFRHLGNGRTLGIYCNNSFPDYPCGPGDSQTGVTTWATQPPTGSWIHVTVQTQTIAGGDQVRATWTLAEGAEGTRYAQTRANGIEDSVQAQSVFVGGIANGTLNQGAVRVQYVRGRTGYLDNTTVDAQRQSTDTSGWDFWWRFYDNAGNLAVEDLTGNNRVPTITGGTFVAGPVVPGVS